MAASSGMWHKGTFIPPNGRYKIEQVAPSYWTVMDMNGPGTWTPTSGKQIYSGDSLDKAKAAAAKRLRAARTKAKTAAADKAAFDKANAEFEAQLKAQGKWDYAAEAKLKGKA
jgi:hypothetical protein